MRLALKGGAHQERLRGALECLKDGWQRPDGHKRYAHAVGGMEVLKGVKADPNIPVLLVTAFGTVEKAVEAVKQGDDSY